MTNTLLETKSPKVFLKQLGTKRKNSRVILHSQTIIKSVTMNYKCLQEKRPQLILEHKSSKVWKKQLNLHSEPSLSQLLPKKPRELKHLPPRMPTTICLKAKNRSLTNIEISEYLNVSQKNRECHNNQAIEYQGKMEKNDSYYYFFGRKTQIGLGHLKIVIVGVRMDGIHKKA